jgi:plastocyanin
MKTNTVISGFAVALMACGGEKPAETPAVEAAAAAPAPAPAAAGATHDVNMVLEGTTYKFVPAELTVKVGDQVVFHNVSGGPHNVQFYADSIPVGAQAVIDPQFKDALGPLSSMLVTEPNATIAVSFAGAPVGMYGFTCTPHMAMKMNGRITVTQ